jgi:hypothetical protein
MRRSVSSDNPDSDSACAPASPQKVPEREARPAAFIGPNDRPDLMSKMIDEPIRGFVEASCIEQGEERAILAQGAASADEDKDIEDRANRDTKDPENPITGKDETKDEAEKFLKDDKDDPDKIHFDKGQVDKEKEVSDKEKEQVSDKDEVKDFLDKKDGKEESEKEKEVSEKDKEFEKELEEDPGQSAMLSIEEWASRHQAEAVRLINPGPQDELL